MQTALHTKTKNLEGRRRRGRGKLKTKSTFSNGDGNGDNDDEEDGDALPRALGAAQVLLEPRRTRVASSAPRLHEVVPHGEEGRIG